jgi:hypothetical protein
MRPRLSRPIPLLILFLILGYFFLLSPSWVSAAADEMKTAKSQDSAQATPDSVTAEIPQKQAKGQTYDKALVIHRPMPDPAWGKLIQYHSETGVDTSNKQKETIFSFVFQDDKGIIRVANYHESDSGEGYWEIYQWDLQ